MDPFGLVNGLVSVSLLVLAIRDCYVRPGSLLARLSQWLLVYGTLYTLSRAFLVRDLAPRWAEISPMGMLLGVGVACVSGGLLWTTNEQPDRDCWNPHTMCMILGVVACGLLLYKLFLSPRISCMPLTADWDGPVYCSVK